MNYLKRIFSTGAIGKTPKKVLSKISTAINLYNPSMNVIEIGAGNGEITACILAKEMSNYNITYYAFEIHPIFCTTLKNTFPNINVINKDAFEFENCIPAQESIDYFISSIPLSFYTEGKTNKLLRTVKDRLTNDGKIIIIFNAPWLIPKLKKQLPDAKVVSFLTIPFYFVMIYNSQNM